MIEWQLFPRWNGGHYPVVGYWSRNTVAGKLLVFSYVVLPRSGGAGK